MEARWGAQRRLPFDPKSSGLAYALGTKIESAALWKSWKVLLFHEH